MLPLGDDEDETEAPKEQTELTTSQKQDLEQLKREFATVISDVPGDTKLVSHVIDTGDSQPVAVPPYRLAYADRDLLLKDTKTMLEQGIIKPSTSPWASPLLYVPKKDGSKRPVIDYRGVNKKTQRDPYPMPNVLDLIDRLGPAKYITALDLTKGYTGRCL